jgi:hypothetical protein
LSFKFAENVGLDETLVLEADFAHGTPLFGTFRLGTPQAFASRISFTHSFLYNPQAGNLLFDMRSYGARWGEVSVQGLAAAVFEGDGISAVSRADVNSPTGIHFTGAYIMQWEYSPVPEPSALALVVGGCGLLAAFRIKWRTRHRLAGIAVNSRQGNFEHVTR